MHKLCFISNQETVVDILFDNECKDLGSKQDVNSEIELCTGRKKKFPRIETYEMKGNAFEKIGTELDYLGLRQNKYNFYVGGSDSCQGRF